MIQVMLLKSLVQVGADPPIKMWFFIRLIQVETVITNLFELKYEIKQI